MQSCVLVCACQSSIEPTLFHHREPTKFIVPTGPTGTATGPQDEDPKEEDTKSIIDPKLLGTGATGMFDAFF
jgi:hypothetical protein